MRIEIRNDSVILDGYVNAVARDSRPMLDEQGEKFVEQISPKTFQRALEKNDDIFCLLNHEPERVLGSTKQGNIELFEDNIGLRAICKITDSEVIEKAKQNKLRGWSFGFEALKEHEEALENGLKRRFVDEMNLAEVSIIDEQKIPCYVGTSIETRADKSSKLEYRGRTVSAFYSRDSFDDTTSKITRQKYSDESSNRSANYQFDYSEYETILEKLKK
ncbi:MAG: HK97 family phage prohead protease [Bacilli bacterium]